MNKIFLTTLILLIAIFSANVAAAADFEYKKSYEKGPFSVIVRADKKKINLAEMIELQIVARSAEKSEITFDVPSDINDFEIYSRSETSPDQDFNSRMLALTLEPDSVGDYEIPGFRIVFDDPNTAKTYEIYTKPVPVEIYSVLSSDSNSIQTIADITEPLKMPFDYKFWFTILVIASLCIILLFAIIIIPRRAKQKKQVKVYRPAHELALEKLNKLLNDKNNTDMPPKIFYQHLSNIIRLYIEDRFALQAPDRTTEEFLSEIQFDDKLNPHDKDALGDFLTHCDMVKFAGYNPAPGQIEETINTARQFINRTKSQTAEVDVTDMQNEEVA